MEQLINITKENNEIRIKGDASIEDLMRVIHLFSILLFDNLVTNKKDEKVKTIKSFMKFIIKDIEEEK